jgi:Rrf2 family protein
MQISAKVDYGVRALLVLATSPEPMTAEAIAVNQQIPGKFLGVILNDLRRAGILVSHRGREAGYSLERPAADISLADVIRALEGPLAQVRGMGPESAKYEGVANHLQEVWVALRASLRGVLEHTNLEDVVKGDFPPEVARMVAAPDAWVGR